MNTPQPIEYMTHSVVKDLIERIKNTAEAAGVKAKQADGLYGLLNNASKLADEKRTDQDSQYIFQTIYMLDWSLERLKKKGLDFSHHLKEMRQGSTTLGTQDFKESRYKGFEFELHIAAALTPASVNLLFLPQNDDFDIAVDEVVVECKQPDSPDIITIQGYLSDFNAKLYKAGKFGIFALGMEDMFRSLDRDPQRLDELETLQSPLHKEFNKILDEIFVPFLCSQRQVLGVIVSQTSPVIDPVNGDSMNYSRLVNGLFIDRPTKYQQKLTNEIEVVKKCLSILPSNHTLDCVKISDRWFELHPSLIKVAR